MKTSLQSLCDYISPAGMWSSPKNIIKLPYFSLAWKSLTLMMAQIALVAVGVLYLFHPGETDKDVLISLLMVPAFVLEVMMAGILVKWYYAGIKAKHVLLREGEAVESIPFMLAVKMGWAFSWRLWFMKLMMMTMVWVSLAVFGVQVPGFDAMAIIASESFSKLVLRYDSIVVLLSVMVFFPRIQWFYPEYSWRKQD